MRNDPCDEPEGEKRGGALTGGVLGVVRRGILPPSRKHGAPSPTGPTETTHKKPTGEVLGKTRRGMPPPSRKHGAPSAAGPTETTNKKPNTKSRSNQAFTTWRLMHVFEVWNSKIGTTKDEWVETWKVRPMYSPAGPGVGYENTTQEPVDGVGRRMRVQNMQSPRVQRSGEPRAHGDVQSDQIRVLKKGGETGDKTRAGHGARTGSAPRQAMDSHAWEGREDDRQGRDRSDLYGVESDIRGSGTSTKNRIQN